MEVWQDLFPTPILQRGRNYFEQHKVLNLIHQGEKIDAIVAGTKEYHVEVILDEDGYLVQMRCDCPYFMQNGRNCKHMAAVLFRLDADSQQHIFPDDQAHLVQRVLHQESDKELRQFLTSFTQENAFLGNQFLNWYYGKNQHERQDELRAQLQVIFEKFADDSEEIPAQQTQAYFEVVERLLTQVITPLIVANQILQAFRLVNQVFIEASQHQFQSEKETVPFFQFCYQKWDELYQRGSISVRRSMFAWFLRWHTIGRTARNVLGIESATCLWAFLLNAFHEPEFLKQKLQLMDARIAESEKADDQSGLAQLALSGYVWQRLQLMTALHYPAAEILKFAQSHRLILLL